MRAIQPDLPEAESQKAFEHAIVHAVSGPLSVDVVTDMAAVEADWQCLEHSPLNSVHQSYWWCAAWSKAMGTPIVIIRGQVSGQTVFLIPLEIRRKGPFRVARFPGGNFNNINTGLFDDAYAQAAKPEDAQLILSEIRRQLSDRVDVLALQNIPLTWRGRRHPLSALATSENQNRSFQLPLLPRFEDTLAQVNAKRRRKKYRVQTKRLNEIGGYEYYLTRDRQEQHALLDTFFQQKAERFAAQKIPDVFQDKAIKSFFHGLIDAPYHLENVPLELHAIRLPGSNNAVAALAGLSRKGDHVICQFGSIHQHLAADASPGELLFWLMIEKSCAEGAAIFDFGIGDQLYKRSWCTVETVQHDIFRALSVRGYLPAIGYRALASLKSFIKAHPKLYGFIQSLRAKKDTAKPEPESV